MSSRARVVLSCVMAVIAITALPAYAIDVELAQWGFDGRVLTSEFNPLSILVTNPSGEPFDGVITLHRSTGGGASTGARLVEQVYVANNSTRWVQFYPYCASTNDSWTVRWRDEGKRRSFQISPPRVGSEEPVLLDEPNNFSSAGKGIKHFNEELFPPSVSGTKSLSVMVIDRVPRWEAPRRQAFMDWLRLGGVVHLLHSGDGKFPQFTAELAELNSPLNLQRIGAGVVFRHAWPREDLDTKSVKELSTTRKRFVESLSGGEDLLEFESDNVKASNPGNNTWSEVYGLWDTDSQLFGVLKQLTQPDHNWALIYLLSFVYIAMIFPGCFLLGRRRVHFLLTYGAIVGCVVLFSVIFLMVGRRGYGEQTKINSIAFAQQIEGDNWDVSQFSNIFVTSGDTYDVAHQGEGTVYSTCSVMEAVNGDIDNGVQGSFSVDVPPFSNRPFAHRMKIKLPQLNVTKTVFKATDRLSDLELQIGAGFPEKTITMFAQYRHGFYKVKRVKDRLVAEPSRFKAETFMQLKQYGSMFGGNGGMIFGDTVDAEKDYHDMWRGVLARHLGIIDGRRVQSYSLPTDRARLFVFTDSPDQLRVTSEQFPAQTGLVLYAIDILRNESNEN